MKKFKVGSRVRTIKDHSYLGVTRKAVGIVTSNCNTGVEVKFRKVRNAIIFSHEELVGIK